MNKADAAKYLGIGTRTLERYTGEGRIQAARVRSRTGPTLDYTEEELSRFKAELEAPPVALGEAVAEPDEATPQPTKALAKLEARGLPVRERAHNGAGRVVALDQLAELAARLGELGGRAYVSPADKILLTLDECSALTGLSRGRLRAAVADESLKAKRIGRAWRVQREELERWVKSTC